MLRERHPIFVGVSSTVSALLTTRGTVDARVAWAVAHQLLLTTAVTSLLPGRNTLALTLPLVSGALKLRTGDPLAEAARAAGHIGLYLMFMGSGAVLVPATLHGVASFGVDHLVDRVALIHQLSRMLPRPRL
jgi:hypothetical protein